MAEAEPDSRPPDSRLQKLRKSARAAVARWFEEPVSAALVAVGFGANAATIAGFLLAVVAAGFAAVGEWVIAGLISIPAALFDMIDGAVARRTGKVTDRGALLDSTFDRLSEAALLLGLAIYYSSAATHHQTGVILAFVAFIGSIMVSYVRARAEGLGYAGTSGFLTRPERVVIMTVALLLGLPLVGLWILAVGTPLSAAYRFWAEWRHAE